MDGGPERWTVHLNVPDRLAGLTLQVPGNFQFEASQPVDLVVTQNKDRVLVSKAEGKIELIFRTGGARNGYTE